MERSAACKPKPDPSALVFGKQFSDHMLTIDWSDKDGWGRPHIKPFQNLSLHPASSALHYSIEVSRGVTTPFRHHVVNSHQPLYQVHLFCRT